MATHWTASACSGDGFGAPANDDLELSNLHQWPAPNFKFQEISRLTPSPCAATSGYARLDALDDRMDLVTVRGGGPSSRDSLEKALELISETGQEG